jgi:hypothetical protein
LRQLALARKLPRLKAKNPGFGSWRLNYEKTAHLAARSVKSQPHTTLPSSILR